MTEQEWKQCNDAEPMLIYLRGRAIDRKLRLFACACCRRIWNLLSDESRNLLEVLEQWADGQATRTELSTAFSKAVQRNYAFIRGATPHTAIQVAASAVSAAAGEGVWAAAWNTVSEVRRAIGLNDVVRVNVEGRFQAALLRDILNHPMRPCPCLCPAILTWHNGLVCRLASVIYEDRTFNDLPILADALEEAGCDNQDILDHCRGPEPHAKGCWVVDLILDKSCS